jgi:internalin A
VAVVEARLRLAEHRSAAGGEDAGAASGEILRQLVEVLALLEKEHMRVQGLFQQGRASAADVLALKVRIAEARLRLAKAKAVASGEKLQAGQPEPAPQRGTPDGASQGPRRAPPGRPRPVTIECSHATRTYLVAPGQWVPHGCSLAVPYRGGSHLTFERGAASHMTVRVDGRPPQAAWINANTDEGLAIVKRELARGTRGFLVLCTPDRLDALPRLPASRDLALTVSGGLTDFGPLMRHTGVSALAIFSRELTDLGPLAEFRDLTSLRLIGCRGVKDLRPATRLPRLEWLRIVACPAIEDFSPLAKAPALRGLHVRTGEAVSDLGFLARLQRLQVLHLAGAESVTDLAPLGGLTDLRVLHLMSTKARDLAPLASLTRLEELSLFASKQVADLGPLAGLERLRHVDLRGCDAVVNLAPLRGVVERGAKVEVYGNLRDELARLRDDKGEAGAPTKP